MAKAKANDFQNLENTKADLLIFTSTLTAGVSINYEHYNESINYYAYNTCSAISTI